MHSQGVYVRLAATTGGVQEVCTHINPSHELQQGIRGTLLVFGSVFPEAHVN